jgi:hypothetical protein
MPFPILALVAAAAKDMGNRNDANMAKSEEDRQYQARIRRHMTDMLGGGNPYDRMRTDHEAQLSGINRAEDKNSNNMIGSLLQSYLGQSLAKDALEKAPETSGSGSPSPFGPPSKMNPSTYQGGTMDNVLDDVLGKMDNNISSGRWGDALRGAGDIMGKSQEDPWDKDPWGDAGF